MADYKKAIPVIKKAEGGLSKNPADNAARFPVPDGSGYHTNKGITWQTFKTYAKMLNYVATPKLFYVMPDHIWLALYKKVYWDAVKADKLDSLGVAIYLVDFAFNSGPGNAVKQLQQTLNKNFGFKLKEDGAIGNNTITAANKVAADKLLQKFNQERIDFIVSSSRIDDSLNKGLISRINEIYDFAKDNVAVTAAIGLGTILFFLVLGI